LNGMTIVILSVGLDDEHAAMKLLTIARMISSRGCESLA